MATGTRHRAIAGNFALGECFADIRCRHGHETRLFNIGRGHYVACDTCRSFIFVGSNLMSSWRKESEDNWRHNARSIEGYTEVVCLPDGARGKAAHIYATLQWRLARR